MDDSPGRGPDTERFVRLFADGQREILRYILALVPDIDDAHEIMQDTAVALWRRFDQYRPDQPFVPWACRFAFRHVLKFREKKGRRGKFLSIEAIELLATERLEGEEIFAERRRALQTCLRELRESDRLLVERRYSSRTTVARVAEETGQDVALLYRTLEKVRRRLLACINRRLATGDLT
jgi:RNA polymerase sigma-70 factor, ECF subfamily